MNGIGERFGAKNNKDGSLFDSSAIRRTFAAIAAGLLSLAATPALAQSSAAAAGVASVPAVVQDAEIVAGQDQNFRQLFSRWEALDARGQGAQVSALQVSIPSRMPLESATLTSDYGMRTHPILGGRRNHKGVDLAAPSGTPVYATADGMVGRADWYSSYGLYVQIEHGAELETRYAHLSQIAVAAGDRVRKGDLIGYVGTTGRSTGPHLHYEVRVAGDAVNPLPYMAESRAQQAFAVAIGQGGQGGPE